MIMGTGNYDNLGHNMFLNKGLKKRKFFVKFKTLPFL